MAARDFVDFVAIEAKITTTTSTTMTIKITMRRIRLARWHSENIEKMIIIIIMKVPINGEHKDCVPVMQFGIPRMFSQTMIVVVVMCCGHLVWCEHNPILLSVEHSLWLIAACPTTHNILLAINNLPQFIVLDKIGDHLTWFCCWCFIIMQPNNFECDFLVHIPVRCSMFLHGHPWVMIMITIVLRNLPFSKWSK